MVLCNTENKITKHQVNTRNNKPLLSINIKLLIVFKYGTEKRLYSNKYNKIHFLLYKNIAIA